MKKSIKWFIAVVVAIIIIAVCILPMYKKQILVTAYEDMLKATINYAIEHYEEYEETKDVKCLERLAGELQAYERVLLKLEDVKNPDGEESYAQEVNMVKNVLQDDRENVVGLDKLYTGLKALEENVYSEIGYGMLLDFYNQNVD